MNVRAPLQRPTALVMLSGPVLAITTVVVGALTPGYSHAHDTVSLLGASGHAISIVACTGIVLYGALVVAGARSVGAHEHGHRIV